MLAKWKFSGFVLAILGVLLAWADVVGAFTDKEKVRFANRVMSTQDAIPRSTPGFEKFLAAFPPPREITSPSVTHIADKVLRVSSDSDVGSSVAYLANGARTPTVARFDEVHDWTTKTIYRILGLIITTAGILIAAPSQIHDYRKGKLCAKPLVET